VGLGEAFFEQAFDLIQKIAKSPHQFPSVAPPVRRALLHRFPYAIYFLLEEETLMIIAVLHQRRDPSTVSGSIESDRSSSRH
jgi:plasmid stabilization system protein ParE